MACRQCEGIEAFFDDGVARRELRRYRRKGVGGTTRILLEALRSPSAGTGVAGRSFLDIGGGVGAIQHELMAAGATHGTHADASPAYLDAARSEGERRGHADRVRYVLGDFVDVADDIEPADVVTLDRVVCCYPDMPALVDASASRALESYGLVFPRVTPLTRVAFRILNLVQTLRRHPFHVFLHDTRSVEARVKRHGLHRIYHRETFFWQVMVFQRTSGGARPQPTHA